MIEPDAVLFLEIFFCNLKQVASRLKQDNTPKA